MPRDAPVGVDVVEGVTVDAPGTTVREDGFRVTRSGGGWVVDVAVALVADAVPIGGDLDRVAREFAWGRGRALSDVARSRSLDPGLGRRAVVTTVRLSGEGRMVDARARIATFSCLAALDWQEAASAWVDALHPLHDVVSPAWEAARAFDVRRGRAGRRTDVMAGLGELANASLAAAFEASGLPVLYAVGGWDRERATTSARPGAAEMAGGGSYARFTSPLRRYADLVNQRILVGALLGRGSPYDERELDGIAREIDSAPRG